MSVPWHSARLSVPRGITGVGILFLFGTIMASLAGTTLVWPGTALDHAWALKPRAYRELGPLGWKAGVPFLLLAATLCAAGVGWVRPRLWGWRLPVVLIAAQVIGNTINLFFGHIAEGATGLVVPGALLAYLLLPRVITVFREGSSREEPD